MPADPNVRITQGRHCLIDPLAMMGFEESGKGRIALDHRVRIRPYAILRTCGGLIQIGTRSVVGVFSALHGAGGITIGEGVLISPHVGIYAQNHGIAAGRPIGAQAQSKDPIVIEDDVWIGANAVIIGTTTIGRGAVIGAGCVVASAQIPPNAIVVGNPYVIKGYRK